MFHDHLRKRREEDSLFRGKPSKNIKKPLDQSLPPSIRPQKVPNKTKELIYQLEEEYIKRYNILINNRQVYKQTIESMSTELDGVGITPEILMEMYRDARREENQEGTQAER